MPTRRPPPTLPLARVLAWTAVGALALVACGRAPSPEDQVRAVIAAAEQAAEARDAPALLDLVAPDYRDGQGNDAGEIGRYLRGYIIAHPSIHLLVRVESIELPARDLARVRATVGMLGRGQAAGASWDLAADVYEFDVTLALEDGDWRVTRADWHQGIAPE